MTRNYFKWNYFKWNYIAYTNGNKSTKVGLNILNGKMTKKDIAKSKKLAEDWMKTHKEIDSKLTSANIGITLPKKIRK